MIPKHDLRFRTSFDEYGDLRFRTSFDEYGLVNKELYGKNA
ncbi:hypothetical protein RG963_04355 [Methanosarcina sp. Z-7115]|uniref:Uncharacterized protein n=1 Tax=Methanosarcina baikalica TaxID=3073890 RepID=A0ABU2CZ67_9EURY|nr:hypothetical protein [Methanosarcina sp. Z-7115]MDR7665032.1 hypothetical protein [Methanosarcina sp. Z-7115]